MDLAVLNFQKTALVLALAATLGGCPGGEVSTITLGAVLDRLMNRVETAMKQANAVARNASIEAGTQISQAINGMRAAYLESMNATVDKLNATATTQLGQLETSIAKLEAGTAADIQSSIEGAQTIANSLPISNTTPQLRTYSPKLVAKQPEKQLNLVLKGNFPDAAVQKDRPVLIIGNTRLEPVGLTTFEATFQVPHAKLADPEANGVGVVRAEFIVPHETGPFWPFKKRQDGHFFVPLATLPQSPGRLWFTPIIQESKTDIDDVQTSNMVEDDSGQQTRCGPQPPAGWSVVPSSVNDKTFITVDQHGGRKYHDWDEGGVVSTTPALCWRIDTRGGGRITFALKYKVQRTVVTERQGDRTSISMNWTESRALPLPASGKWKVEFEPSGAVRQEFTGPGKSVPPYLEVGVAGGQVTVNFSVPPEIP